MHSQEMFPHISHEFAILSNFCCLVCYSADFVILGSTQIACFPPLALHCECRVCLFIQVAANNVLLLYAPLCLKLRLTSTTTMANQSIWKKEIRTDRVAGGKVVGKAVAVDAGGGREFPQQSHSHVVLFSWKPRMFLSELSGKDLWWTMNA